MNNNREPLPGIGVACGIEIGNFSVSNDVDGFSNEEVQFSDSNEACKGECSNSLVNNNADSFVEPCLEFFNTTLNDPQPSTDLNEPLFSGLSASMSSLSLRPAYHTRRTGSFQAISIGVGMRKVGASRARELKLRKEKAELQNALKKQEIEMNHLQILYDNLKENHKNKLQLIRSLEQKNQCLTNTINFHKSNMDALRSYQSSISGSAKLNLATSFLSIGSSYKRAPKGFQRHVNKYYQRIILEGPKERKQSRFVVIKSAVHMFYLDDEISTPSPGKKEFITRKKVKKGKRYLTDSLTNLYFKFCKSNENMKISKALFFKLRPFWVLQPKISTRDTCLCKEHTNFKFLIERLHYLKLLNIRSTTQCLKLVVCEPLTPSCAERTCELCENFRIIIPEDKGPEPTFYHEWVTETKTREGAGKKIYKVNITVKRRVLCTVSELVDTFSSKLKGFLRHVYLVTHQHISFKKIRGDLDFKEAVIAFDFSTNYVGKCREEIQSSNYGASKQQISLQTGIIYYRDKSSNLIKHASFGTVCDFLQHDAAAAWAYLEPVFPYLMELVPDVEIIHFMSDGPTSQYKNKRFLYVLKYFCKKLLLKKATQNYSGPGHGKGGPDAEGAIIKRNGDNDVLRGKDILCAQDLIDANTKNPDFLIKMFKVEKEDVERIESIIPEDLGPIKKILSAYQVTWSETKPTQLNLKFLTCAECHSSMTCCEHHDIYNYKYIVENDKDETRNKKNKTPCKKSLPNAKEESYKTGDWIIVRYDNQWYPGRIEKIKKNILLTKFLDRSDNDFFWPAKEDIQNVLTQQVLCKINPPNEKNQRYYLDEDEFDEVNELSENCPIYDL